MKLRNIMNEGKFTKVHKKKAEAILKKTNSVKGSYDVIPHKDKLYVSYTNWSSRAIIARVIAQNLGIKYKADGRMTNAPRGILGLGGANWMEFVNEDINEGKLNKKDVAYQLSIDYSGNTKPKITKLNNKEISIFYGYKINPKEVIKSIEKVAPAELKHKKWSSIMTGGGIHTFTYNLVESNDLVFNHGKFGGTGVPFPTDEPNEFAYLDFKKWAKKNEKKIKKQMSILRDDRIFRAMEFVWQTWDKKANNGAFSNIKGNKFGRALVKMMWKDNLVFDTKSNKIIKLKELAEATNLWKHFDAKMKLQDTIMDLEYDMKMITKDIAQLHKDMEQEAEPGGGKIADRYGRDIEKKEKEYKKKKAEFKKLMAKLDKMEMY